MLQFTRITPRQVVAQMARGERVTFVDARSEDRWLRARWTVSGAVRVRLDSIVKDAVKIAPRDVVVVFGENDREPQIPEVAGALGALGFQDVRVLAGGFGAWAELRYACEAKTDALAQAA